MAVRNLVARAGIDLSDFEKGLKTMEKKLAKTAKQLEAIGKTMTAAFTAPVVALAALSLKTVAYADELATTATKIDMTAESLQKWQYIAKQTDVENEVLTKGFVKFRSAVGDKLTGKTNTSTKALENLGFSMKDLENSTPEVLFESVVKKLSKINNSTLQAAHANDIFGDKLANDLLPLFKAGGGAIDKYTEEFEKIGYLSNEQVAKLAEFDNEMNRVKQTVMISGAQLGTAFLPILESLLKIFEAIAPAIQTVANLFANMPSPVQNTLTVIMLLLAALGPLLIITAKLMMAFKTIIPVIKLVAGVTAAKTAATTADTTAEIANTTSKNTGVLALVAQKIALIASSVATGVMSGITWAATAAQWALNAAFYASPLGWIALLVIALIAVFVLLWHKLKGFKEFFVLAWEIMVQVVKGAVNGIIAIINGYISVYKFMINTTIKLANDLIGVLNSVPGVNIPLIPTISESALKIPYLADGGITTGPTLAMIGEGNEDEAVLPLSKLDAMIGTKSNDTMNLYIYMDSHQIVKSLNVPMANIMRLKTGLK